MINWLIIWATLATGLAVAVMIWNLDIEEHRVSPPLYYELKCVNCNGIGEFEGAPCSRCKGIGKWLIEIKTIGEDYE